MALRLLDGVEETVCTRHFYAIDATRTPDSEEGSARAAIASRRTQELASLSSRKYNEAYLELQGTKSRDAALGPLQLIHFPVVVDAVLAVRRDLDPHDEVRTCGGFA